MQTHVVTSPVLFRHSTACLCVTARRLQPSTSISLSPVTHTAIHWAVNTNHVSQPVRMLYIHVHVRNAYESCLYIVKEMTNMHRTHKKNGTTTVWKFRVSKVLCFSNIFIFYSKSDNNFTIYKIYIYKVLLNVMLQNCYKIFLFLQNAILEFLMFIKESWKKYQFSQKYSAAQLSLALMKKKFSY